MKRFLVCNLIMLLLFSGCSNQSNNESNNESKKENKTTILSKGKEIPKFTIVVKGLVDDTITELSLQDLEIYEIETDVKSYDLDTDSKVYHEKFIGYKLKDVLDKSGITEYNALDFKSTGSVTVRYTNEEVDDNLYLVFYRNDNLISDIEDTPVMLLATNLKKRFWVPSLTRIDVI